MIETDDSFEPLPDGFDYLVDFLDLSFPKMRPDREHSYIEVRPGKAATHSMAVTNVHQLLWAVFNICIC